MALFHGAPETLGLVGAGAIDIRGNENVPFQKYIPQFRGNIAYRILIENCVGLTSVVLVKKECFNKAGLFDESLKGSEDWDMWIRIAQLYDVDFTPEILLRYYPQPDSMIMHHGDGVEAHRKIFKKYHHLFKILPRNYRAARCFHEGFFFWWKREFRECCANFTRAVFLNPRLMVPLAAYFFKKMYQKISGTSYPLNPLSGDLGH